jgi:hypothetical protein
MKDEDIGKKYADELSDIFKIDFISTIENHPNLLYADTDSSYNYFKTPFNKYKNIHTTVMYSQKVAKDCNIKYRNVFDTVLQERANINPNWNYMDFKSEVIATRGFFNTKKFYALAKLWMEGTYYENLEIKKTGGQILKADTSIVTLHFLQEIYDVLTIRVEFNTLEKIRYRIYEIIKKKYIEIITKNINDFNFKEFVIPKKWPINKTKTVPVHLQGAMFYNLIFDDQLRPGDSLLMVPVIINSSLVFKKYQYYKRSPYQIPNELIKDKLNIISFPSDLEFTEEKKQEIILKLQQLNIRIDFDRILNFNIDMKLAQFDKLFSTSSIGRLDKTTEGNV